MKVTQIFSISAFATTCLAFDTAATGKINKDYEVLGQWNYGLRSGTFGSSNLGDAMIAEVKKLEDPWAIEEALQKSSQNSAEECSALAEVSEGFSHRLSDLFHNVEEPKILCDASFQSKIPEFGSRIAAHPHLLEVAEGTLKRDCDVNANDVKTALEAFPQAFSDFDVFLTTLSDAESTCSAN